MLPGPCSASGARRCALRRLQLAQLGLFDDAQIRAHGAGIDRRPVGYIRRAARLILHERRRPGPARPRTPGARARKPCDRPGIRSSNWPPAPTISQPKPCSQHRSCSTAQEPLDVRAVRHQDVAHGDHSIPAVARRYRCGIFPRWSMRVRTRPTVSSSGSTETSAGQKPPSASILRSDRRGMPLVSMSISDERRVDRVGR